MDKLFLICALAVPSTQFTRPPIASYHMQKSERDRLIDWLKKNGAEEVFIHPNPQEEKLKENGWERVPFLWRDEKIWIRRKEISDKRIKQSA